MLIKKHIAVIFAILAITGTLSAQTLTLAECQQKAAVHYPAIARYGIIEQIKNFNIANANKAYLPQISLAAQATWQSDVTKIDVSFPEGFPALEIPTPDKDQYKVAAEMNQILWDGGNIAAQKNSVAAQAEVEKKQLDTEIYALRERINNVFFGILLLDEQLALHAIFEEELQRSHNRVQSYIANGVANEADLSAVKVEQLKAGQSRLQKESARTAYVQVLAVLIGEPVAEGTTFVKPAAGAEMYLSTIDRPELLFFDAQQLLLESQKSALTAKNMPVLGAFAQGGFGRPALNMFENKFQPFFVGGVRLSWNFGNLYTYGNQKKIIDLKKTAVESQRETFLYNLNIQIPQQQIEIEKFRKTMTDDDEIIRLRQTIKNAAEVKTENGTMTVSDLLKEMNELEAAKQTKTLHEIQYLMAVHNLKYTINK